MKLNELLPETKFHIFGHIHEAYGITSDGVTNYLNFTIKIQNLYSQSPAGMK